jgi:hypothetical protein
MILFDLISTFRELQHVGKVCTLAIILGTALGSYMKVRLRTLPPAYYGIPPIRHRLQSFTSSPICPTKVPELFPKSKSIIAPHRRFYIVIENRVLLGLTSIQKRVQIRL